TVAKNQLAIPLEHTHGPKEARGVTINGTQVHSIRLPSYMIAFETIFGLPNERLSIRHDAGSGAEPYVAGTLLATRKVMEVSGLVRGLDRLLFPLELGDDELAVPKQLGTGEPPVDGAVDDGQQAIPRLVQGILPPEQP